MSEQSFNDNPVNSFLPTDIEGFDFLAELALDLRWSWNHSADEMWKEIDPALWEITHNPWVILQTVSRNRIKEVLSDAHFRGHLSELVQIKRNETEQPAWFQHVHPQAPLTCAAYFSMEFMLSEALPIYSGGLGNVAGDQLKAANDLGVPVVGVGLLYQQGYFRQVIDMNGAQEALFPYNDPGQLPLTPLREADGEWLRLEIPLPGYSVWVRAFQVQVGRVKLYLLDTNDAANFPAHRGITSELYGGGSELRLKQELVLAIGGWRLLRTLGLRPEVCHLNEGHAAFAVLERARCFMKETGLPFQAALAVTRAGNLFTTHTPVAAGFDRFDPHLIELYLGDYARNELGISLHDLMAFGRQDPNDSSEPFNMAYLAIKGSGAINGVSRLHGEVSRRIFQVLFPRWPEVEVPVGYITNGVHMPTWDSPAADELWTGACGKDRWVKTTKTMEHDIRALPDIKLWNLRNSARKELVEYARERLTHQLIASGMAPKAERVKHIFDPGVLTLGFARRFATYKRPNLLLHDPERLIRILSNPDRPAQLILAGKSHPADQPGQAMIQEWIHFIRRPDVRDRVMFLGDYDMFLAERLVQGIDVWINTPRRPWEASGTSGMKVLVNGGLNLSIRDGWWAEAYSPEVGWAFGDDKEHGDDPAWDASDAEALYDLLEYEVIPEFYTRDTNDIPTTWVARIRESMVQLTPRFSADRTVRQYTEEHYLPAAAAYRERAADNGAPGLEIVNWQDSLKQKWPSLRFGALKVEEDGDHHVFEVELFLDGLDPDAVQAELYAEGVGGGAPVRQLMTRVKHQEPEEACVYSARVPSTRPTSDYTPRLIPHRPGVSVPLEAAEILWQR